MMGNAQLAANVVALCRQFGVGEFMVAAGARNAPLLRALHEACPEQLTPFIDERSAGFYALGRIMESGNAVAVVTTSGTAVAELLPAVVEAHYQGRRLVVVSADRPVRYRGSGAPQAIEQAGIFRNYPVLSLDLSGELASPTIPKTLPPGPVHINVCLEEPTPEEPVSVVEVSQEVGSSLSKLNLATVRKFLQEGDRPLILCGPMLPEEGLAVSSFLSSLEVPVLSESAANLSDGDLILRGGEATLREQTPDRVLRIGGIPTARWWRDLESIDIPVLNVSAAPFSGLARESEIMVGHLSSLAGEWGSREGATKHWLEEGDLAAWGRLKEVAKKFPQSEASMVGAVSALVPPGASLFLGNSMPIRLWSMMAGGVAGNRKVYANRGANGIDGNLATFLGIAAGGGEAWAVVGDLTALYDLNACLTLSSMTNCGALRIVVVNNGGGKIFERLPAFRSFPQKVQELVENQHSRDFADFATLWGMEYRVISQYSELQEGMNLPERVLIELSPDAKESAAFWEALS